jgi:hypothetical protein
MVKFGANGASSSSPGTGLWVIGLRWWREYVMNFNVVLLLPFPQAQIFPSALCPNSIDVYFRLSVLFNDAVNREGYRVTFDIWINEYGTLVEWYWQGKNRNTREKTSPTATMSTTNPTYTDLGTNPNRRGKRSATNRRRLHNKLSVHFLDILYTTSLETLLSRNR